MRLRALSAVSCLVAALTGPPGASAAPELEVHRTNPRWLTDDGGETALVLTGAHTWSLFQDYELGATFDAGRYLEKLARQGHNFTRGWFWEDTWYSPTPYAAVDGLYRLSPPYEPDFVRQLRRRIRKAGRHGLYVSVMLFQGWSMDDRLGLRDPDPWPRNPYNRANTREAVTKQQAALHVGLPQSQQLAYVSHLAERLCGEPNILWEVVNEAHHWSLGTDTASNWQRNILRHLHSECDRHLTWVSCPGVFGDDPALERRATATMYAMDVDLVSPCDPFGAHVVDPPAADGRKVVIADSDHLGPGPLTHEWAWKAFLRGQHPVFMDLGEPLAWWNGDPWDVDDPEWARIRRALGAIQELVAAVNAPRGGRAPSGLADMAPQSAAGGDPGDRSRPASSPWALYSANRPCPGRAAGRCDEARANGDELLVYAGASAPVTICRLQSRAQYRYRWKRSARPGYLGPAVVRSANAQGCMTLENPAEAVAILHVERVLDGSEATGG